MLPCILTVSLPHPTQSNPLSYQRDKTLISSETEREIERERKGERERGRERESKRRKLKRGRERERGRENKRRKEKRGRERDTHKKRDICCQQWLSKVVGVGDKIGAE